VVTTVNAQNLVAAEAILSAMARGHKTTEVPLKLNFKEIPVNFLLNPFTQL
jgi:hypothetical protein